MGTIGNPRDYLILTNNPLVPACMEGKGLYTIDFRPQYRPDRRAPAPRSARS